MGISERRLREKERRRVEIIDAAEKLFFSKGLEAVTMEDVAEAAELSKGTLYLYFRNKNDLYFAVTGRGLEILIGLFIKAVKNKKNGMAQVRAIGDAYYQFFKKYANYFNAFIYWDVQMIEANLDCPMAQACGLMGDQALAITAQAIAAGVADGSIRPDVDPTKAAIVLWGHSTGIFQLLASKGEHFLKEHEMGFPFKKLEELVMYSFDMIGHSLRNPAAGGNGQ